MKQLAEFQPWFIEEPTSPDDILGHARIRRELRRYNIGVATGEQCQNRVMWKQLFQAEAIDIAQIDACRVGGVNEVLAILLMAKKYAHFFNYANERFGVPVVPHSGGVGLPEYTQHISTIDYVLISKKKSLLEYVDHLHGISFLRTSLILRILPIPNSCGKRLFHDAPRTRILCGNFRLHDRTVRIPRWLILGESRSATCNRNNVTRTLKNFIT